MATDDYDVGYGKPPVATRFTKGKSGNPRGRPKKKDSAASSELERVLSQVCGTAVVGGQTKLVKGQEFMIRGLALKAVKTLDVKAAERLLLRQLELRSQLAKHGGRASKHQDPPIRFVVLPETLDLETWEAIAVPAQQRLYEETQERTVSYEQA